MRWLITAALPLFMAGCTTVDDPFLETGSVRPDALPLASEVSPEFAAAYLPAASGRIESVRQAGRGYYLEQAIVYTNGTASAGENVLTVRIGRPEGEDTTFRRAPTRRAILSEMRSALPGVAMAIEPVLGENVHGVYGYATGSLGPSGSCLYAWQYARRVSPASGDTAVDRLRSPAYAAQVRLRFCHPEIPRERIAALMNGMRLKPVTRETFDMLRYAAGSGQIRKQPVLPKAEPVAVLAEDNAHVEPRRTPKRKAEKAVAIRNAVRVPLPGEVMVQELKEERPEETRSASVLVPLPGAE